MVRVIPDALPKVSVFAVKRRWAAESSGGKHQHFGFENGVGSVHDFLVAMAFSHENVCLPIVCAVSNGVLPHRIKQSFATDAGIHPRIIGYVRSNS